MSTLLVDLLEEYSPISWEPASVAFDFYILPGANKQYRLEDKIRGSTIAYGSTAREALENANIDVDFDFEAQAVVEIARMPHTWSMRFGRCRNGLVFASVDVLSYFGSTSPHRPHTEYSTTFSGAIRLLRQNVDPALTDLRKWLEDMRLRGHVVRLRHIRGEYPYYRVEMVTKYGRHYQSHGVDPYSALMMFGIYVTDDASKFFVDEDE